MTDSCNVCGKTESLMNCKRCKSVAYCGAKCQRQDWKDHKPVCQRKEFAGVPCDVCKNSEKAIDNCCYECGFLFCEDCDEQSRTRKRCPRCHKSRDLLTFQKCIKKYEKLIKEHPDDPRLPRWLVHVGVIYHQGKNETRDGQKKAKEYFLRAGSLGLADGYTMLAQNIYMENQNWVEAKRYYRKAADMYDVTAITALALEAMHGGFPHEEPPRPFNFEEGMRLYLEGARLGDPASCAHLGLCYLQGMGTEKNPAKGFKWSKRAAEMGNGAGMFQCGNCYLNGEGVEQSNEQAQYWLEQPGCVRVPGR